jgi:N6-adenosine-specific RNA methylase IME4
MTPDPKAARLVKRLVRNDTNESYFELRPIEVGGFKLGGRRAVPVGRPTLEGYAAALQFACDAHEGSPYWIADLVSYGDGREDWKERLSQAQSVTGLSIDRLHDLGYVGRRTPQKARQVSPSIEHSRAVAKLPDELDRLDWLRKARAEGWSVRDLRLNLKAARRAKVIEGQAVLEGQYRVWLCDPPWSYRNIMSKGTGQHDTYEGMSIEDMCKLPVEAHAAPDAIMFCWVTAPMLYEQPGPNEVIRAWGFTPKTGMVWYKRRHNWGNYVSIRHEHVIIATRGSCTPDRPTPMIDSVFTSELKSDHDLEHSEKPEDLRRIIERLYDGPRIEMFARRATPGWATFGNDARLVNAPELETV